MVYFEKNWEVIYFKSLTLVFENLPKTISIGPLVKEKRPFKKLKILSVLAPFTSKIKKADIFNFLSVKYFGKLFLLTKIYLLKLQNVRVISSGNYEPSNLLFYFTGHNLEQLNNRQRETAVNSLAHYFES